MTREAWVIVYDPYTGWPLASCVADDAGDALAAAVAAFRPRSMSGPTEGPEGLVWRVVSESGRALVFVVTEELPCQDAPDCV